MKQVSERIVIKELVGATLLKCDDADGNLLWDVHFMCIDGVKREYMFVSKEIAEDFALTYVDTLEIN